MLTRWDPFREMVSLRDAVDRLFEESFVRPRGWLTTWQSGVGTFTLDVVEEGDNLIVKASAPGVKPEDIHVEVKDEVLRIFGETRKEEEKKEEKYHIREHHYGRFERSVMLPYPVQIDKAEAVYENGLLTLTLPKGESVRPKQIPIKVKELQPA